VIGAKIPHIIKIGWIIKIIVHKEYINVNGASNPSTKMIFPLIFALKENKSASCVNKKSKQLISIRIK